MVMPRSHEQRRDGDEKIGRFVRRRNALEAQVAQAQGPERLLAQKKLELFNVSHDKVTGALKGEFFGREIGQWFETHGFKKDPQGELRIAPEDHQAHVFLINMGELDRLNALGGHDLGDQSLRQSAEYVETAVESMMGEEGFELYRVSGNDFVLRVAGMDPSEADELRRRLSVSVDVPGKPKELPIPLSVDRTSLADVFELLNELRQRPHDREAFDVEEKPETIAVDVLKELLQTQNDASKFEQRARRMIERIRAVREGSISREQAVSFYTKFQRKSLGLLFPMIDGVPADYDFFEAQAEALGAFGENASPWMHEMHARALAQAARELALRRETHRLIDRGLVETLTKKAGAPFIPVVEEKPVSKLPTHEPELSRGKKKILELQEAVRRAQRIQEEHPQDIELSRAEAFARLDVEIEEARRDALTGFEGRGAMYGALEQALETGKKAGVVYLDMAFLKYFDREGGPETGNLAIQQAAALIDQVAAEFSKQGIDIECYRVGGDEFTLSIIGQDEAMVHRIMLRLMELEQDPQANPLIEQRGAYRAGYTPERLSFNYGLSPVRDAAGLKEFLQGAQLPRKQVATPEETNELADYLVRLADRDVEIRKAMNRMDFLVHRRREAMSEEQGVGTDQVARYEQLEAYSMKAIFGEKGKKHIEAWASRPPKERASIGAEMLEFVLAQIRERLQQNEVFDASLERLIETAVQRQYFERRERELELSVERLQTGISAKDDTIHRLEAELQAVRHEREALQRLRTHLGTV